MVGCDARRPERRVAGHTSEGQRSNAPARVDPNVTLIYLRRLSSRSGRHQLARALLSHAGDFNADQMVVEAYVHSRFREILLGGVTRTVLESMTIFTLMAH